MGTIDIAEILNKRDANKYKDIIIRAGNNGYHDHKFDKIHGHPEYGECICPKLQLVEDLSKFPELNDIKQEVINGKYDEKADEQDIQQMRGWLIEDDAPDGMFKVLGFEPPTKSERLLKTNIKSLTN